MEDIHEPVELYKSVFQEAHARNTAAFFEDLFQKSAIDEAANIQTVKELREIEKKVATQSSYSRKWRIFRGLAIALIVIVSLMILADYSNWWLLLLALVSGPSVYKLNQKITEIKTRLSELESQRDAKCDVAWQQMQPLNQLFEWDIAATLVQQTVPRIAFDPYFTHGRLAELKEIFGLNDEFNHPDRSILFSHSGHLNGNPFVLARTLEHWMGTKTYHGSLHISWTEWETDSKGNRHQVTRHETLHASITKPFPEYGKRTLILYGNEAAPNLSFSRSPSKLSKLEDGFINNWRKSRAVKALEKKSRDLSNGLTIMSNHEFDTLFGALDRDHEVEFRLLFTPLAQQEMLNLLKDKEVGYGDDFHFAKQNMINIVEPDHLTPIDISGDPKLFHGYELAQVRRFFNEYHNNFFKSFFFGIAPLLTIPLYQQHRSFTDIYRDFDSSRSCFWEHETIANYFGHQYFQHPQCITKNILKTNSDIEEDGTQTVSVQAYGYKGEDRTEFVSVYGGDGKYHSVRVDWVEYIAVQNEAKMVVHEQSPRSTDQSSTEIPKDHWQALFQNKGIDSNQVFQRRAIFAAILPTM